MFKGFLNGILIAIVFFGFILTTTYFITDYSIKNTVNYNIRLSSTDVIIGDDVIIFHEITNKYDINVSNILFNYNLKDNYGKSIESFKNKQINYTLEPGEELLSSVKISTKGLVPGTYIAYTNISWTDPITNETEGYDLTLSFDLFLSK